MAAGKGGRPYLRHGLQGVQLRRGRGDGRRHRRRLAGPGARARRPSARRDPGLSRARVHVLGRDEGRAGARPAHTGAVGSGSAVRHRGQSSEGARLRSLHRADRLSGRRRRARVDIGACLGARRREALVATSLARADLRGSDRQPATPAFWLYTSGHDRHAEGRAPSSSKSQGGARGTLDAGRRPPRRRRRPVRVADVVRVRPRQLRLSSGRRRRRGRRQRLPRVAGEHPGH